MNPSAAPGLPVFSFDGGVAGEQPIGRVLLAADYRLSVDSSDAAHGSLLAQACEALNAKSLLMVPALPDADAPRFASSTRSIGRRDPDFLPALIRYLQRYYGLTIGAGVSTGPGALFALAEPSTRGNPFDIDLGRP